MSVNITPRELKVLFAVVSEMTASVDWNKVAPKCDCKTGKYARDTFSAIRKKIAAQVGEGDEAAVEDGSGKKATPKRKGKGDNDDDETPSKKAKPTPVRKAKRAKKDEDVITAEEAEGKIKEEEEEEETNEAGELMDQLEASE